MDFHVPHRCRVMGETALMNPDREDSPECADENGPSHRVTHDGKSCASFRRLSRVASRLEAGGLPCMPHPIPSLDRQSRTLPGPADWSRLRWRRIRSGNEGTAAQRNSPRVERQQWEQRLDD